MHENELGFLDNHYVSQALYRTYVTSHTINAHPQFDIHSILRLSSVRHLGPRMDCFLRNLGVVHWTYGIVYRSSRFVSQTLDPNSC